MAENKRFTIQGRGISDHKRKRLYDLETIDGFISLREVLNELEEENEQLKQRVSELECLLELDKLHKEVEEGKTDKFVELKLND